ATATTTSTGTACRTGTARTGPLPATLATLLLRRRGRSRLDPGSNVSHECGDLGRARVHGARLRGDRGLAEQVARVPALLGEHHRHDVALAAGPRRAAAAVQVCLVLGGRVDVHDELDAVDVHTPRC